MDETIGIEEYLDRYCYSKKFIETYADMVNKHIEENCPNEIYWHSKGRAEHS